MLKSQKHYYWIGGGIWLVLLLLGAAFLLAPGISHTRSGLSEALDSEVFASSRVVTGDPAAEGVLVTPAGEVDVGADGLTLTDPVADPERPPFDLEVPEGRFPALLYRPEGEPRVIGMVALRFSEAEVASWEEPGRKNRPLDFDFGVDDWVALGAPEAVAALDAEAVKAALEGSTGAVPFATITAEGRQVLLLDPSFETFSADIYAGFDAEGGLVLLVKDFGYFGTRDALEKN